MKVNIMPHLYMASEAGNNPAAHTIALHTHML